MSARDEHFGTHLPQLQLDDEVLRAAMSAAGLRPGEHYLEPGSGEGHGLLLAAREFRAQVRGIEVDAAAAARSRDLLTAASIDGTVEQGDLLLADLAGADVVLLHLGPAFADLLAERLERQLAATARVVSVGWEVPGWLPVEPAAGAAATDEPVWVYRPADPACQASPVVVDDAVPADALVLARWRMHADLAALDVVLDAATTEAGRPQVQLGRGSGYRGQLLHCEVRVPNGWSGTASLQLLARGADVGRPLELQASSAVGAD